MGLSQISSDGVGSYDTYGFMIPTDGGHVAPTPEKKLVRVGVPHSDEVMDFSKAFDGSVHYDEREITIKFCQMCSSPSDMHGKIEPFIAWLNDLTSFTDDLLGGYTVTGTVATSIEPDYALPMTSVTATFKADPKLSSGKLV